MLTSKTTSSLDLNFPSTQVKDEKGRVKDAKLICLDEVQLEQLKVHLEQVKAQLEQVRILMLPDPLINFEIQKCYQNEPRFNSVYSRYNLPKIKDGAYIINLDGYKSIGTHWIVLHMNAENVTYFDSFRDEHFPKETKKLITNIYRI